MSMPISDRRPPRHLTLIVVAGLAGCQPARDRNTSVVAQRHEPDDDHGMILCGRNGVALTRTCTLERAETKRGLLLTIRRDDGSFRRLLATRDGRGVIAADGAEPARVSIAAPDQIDVAVGPDLYRLPATVRSPASTARR